MFRTIDRECEWWLGFNMSVAVAVRFIALAGVAAETGVIMLICLDQAMKALQAERAAEGQGVYAGRPMREARSTDQGVLTTERTDCRCFSGAGLRPPGSSRIKRRPL